MKIARDAAKTGIGTDPNACGGSSRRPAELPISVDMRIWPPSRTSLATLLAFVVATGALLLVHDHVTPREQLSKGAAIAKVRHDPGLAPLLAHEHITGARVVPYDGRLEEVNLFDGPQLVLFALVGPAGHVQHVVTRRGYTPQLGAPLANGWGLLLGLTAVFLLAVAVVPLRRVRNLDALVLAGFTANIVAVNEGLIALSVVISVPLLAYLAIRCLAVGVGAKAAEAPASVPLLTWLTARWEASRRLRLARLIATALFAIVLIVTLTSTHLSTVAAASLTGATDLLRWQLPYGHIRYVVHGDTYPLLNYILYLPGAAVAPMSDPWTSAMAAVWVAAAGALVTAAAMWTLARRVLCGDEASGLRAMIAWLAFPPVLLAASGGTNDVLVAAILAWMLVFATSASRSSLLLALAVWTKVVPLVLVPLWVMRRKGEMTRVLVPGLVVSVLLCAYLVGLGGFGALGAMISDVAFPFHRGSLYAPWYTLSVEWLQPVASAAVLAALVLVLMRARELPSLWRDPVRVAGIAGGLLLGMQLSANQWTYTYLPWVFPFIAVALLLERAPARSSEVAMSPSENGAAGALVPREREAVPLAA